MPTCLRHHPNYGMAAFDTPLTTFLTPSKPPRQPTSCSSSSSNPSSTSKSMARKPEPKSTIQAQFPPGQQPVGTTSPVLLPDSKMNLLDSTPPQIVRALGQAEPLVRGLNVVLGLLTWSSGQDWLSFFLVVGWWVVCLYGPIIVKFLGNFIPVACIAAWYLLKKSGMHFPLLSFGLRTVLMDSGDASGEDVDARVADDDVERNRYFENSYCHVLDSSESITSSSCSSGVTTLSRTTLSRMADMVTYHA